jgi:CMP/dCMP kinase
MAPNMKAHKIAIDGPGASGKSTTASLVAKRLGFSHLISGNLYRAVTHALLKNFGEIDLESEKQRSFVKNVEFHIVDGRVMYGDIDITEFLRGCAIDENIPAVARERYVRDKVSELQRRIIGMEKKGIVVDGRDIGTNIMPDADLKIFLTASLETRAKRRHREARKEVYEELLEKLRTRDHMDISRESGPLLVAGDATVINNDNMTLEETVSKILECFNEVRDRK